MQKNASPQGDEDDNAQNQIQNNKNNKSCNGLKHNIKYIFLFISVSIMIALVGINIDFVFKLWSTNEIRGLQRINSLTYSEDISYLEWRNIHLHLYYLLVPLVFLTITQKIIKPYFVDHDQRQKALSFFYIIVGLALSFLLFRLKSIYSLLFITANYALTKTLASKKYFPIFIWVLNLGFLNLAFIFNGFEINYISEGIKNLDGSSPYFWNVVLIYLILRCLSFSIDYHNSQITVNVNESNHFEKCFDCTSVMKCYAQRVDCPHQQQQYCFLNYLSYIYYPPLFFRGPIITFNDYLYQHQNEEQIFEKEIVNSNEQNQYRNIQNFKEQQIVHNSKQFFNKHILYFIKISLMYIFVLALSVIFFPSALLSHTQNEYIWIRKQLPASTIVTLISYVIWKWAIQVFYWKLCYYWSISNDIYPIDNVGKIIINFQDIKDIFRNYERSYYLWIKKYVYIPLGGKFCKFLNIILVIQLFILLNEMDQNLFYYGLEITGIFIIDEIINIKWRNINIIVKVIISGVQISLILFITILAIVPQPDYLTYQKQILKNNQSKMTLITIILVVLAIFSHQSYLAYDQQGTKEVYYKQQCKNKNQKENINQKTQFEMVTNTLLK
ncbi:membrane bound O-acyltransferase, MBOAT protein (macronuclear) [Tetrahymena thermophila SB210]|uniref:Membrane bound O-acyltransferase, MBOAT protein n=1 Tax=Tetrahymena thermophila (strain SB210) TaxID=312017 RepID=W7XD57_TETTS|nr:membrane bound O-acyltransferase, MBOAT protein [Tetrahymena thermophila SB210]EWS71756.1 membrane bound O-acyltransferase, MBOAT protein [Tetrahymena thermophila SB210]|eukprot:XP_012655709.1 membrane bound O-acyltransferase, MBOAT protein [Tetrahymena thermophila SB210]